MKNLESVQGDERDVIVFSLGHAPVERTRGPRKGERYVPARFGPLGQRGGERRLNVAVSRAKSATVIVSSFEPHMLSVAHSKNPGPKLLKAYLEFAWDLSHGRRHPARRILDRVRHGGLEHADLHAPRHVPHLVPLSTQLTMALEDHGLAVETDVGTSTFRVPVALTDPEDPSRYLLAILCDEGREPAQAYERHVHQRGVLEARAAGA